MKTLSTASFAVMFAAAGLFELRASAADGSCEKLSALKLPNVTITMAQALAAGQLRLPAATTRAGAPPSAPIADPFGTLPALCRVAATLTPTSDSDIKMELWMPASGWNGKMVGEGNGGWAGTITYGGMAEDVRSGYAAASTDTGHSADQPGGAFVLGHPEKLIDFAWRSEHEMTVTAKAIIEVFYGRRPSRAYWEGCSTGGRQGLKEAQKFPEDYDGIAAGAPANPFSLIAAHNMYVGVVSLKDPGNYIPAAKYPLLHQAVLNACDALDGVKDGLLTDPRNCHFEPAVLQCKGDDAPTCLTAPQVQTAKKIYGPVVNPRTGEEYYPGLEPGSELGWNVLAGGPQPFAAVADFFKYVVKQDPNWDWRTLDFDKDVELALNVENGLTAAIDTKMDAYQRRGGKLLFFHGWTDQNVPPRNTINYYSSIRDAMGGAKNDDWMRLFLVPGMNHCRGGEGPNTMNLVEVLDNWVERGEAPARIVATHFTDGKPDRTRPVCPYPLVQAYTGSGSVDDAANFVCKAP